MPSRNSCLNSKLQPLDYFFVVELQLQIMNAWNSSKGIKLKLKCTGRPTPADYELVSYEPSAKNKQHVSEPAQLPLPTLPRQTTSSTSLLNDVRSRFAFHSTKLDGDATYVVDNSQLFAQAAKLHPRADHLSSTRIRQQVQCLTQNGYYQDLTALTEHSDTDQSSCYSPSSFSSSSSSDSSTFVSTATSTTVSSDEQSSSESADYYQFNCDMYICCSDYTPKLGGDMCLKKDEVVKMVFGAGNSKEFVLVQSTSTGKCGFVAFNCLRKLWNTFRHWNLILFYWLFLFYIDVYCL